MNEREERLLKAFLDGNEAAFEELVKDSWERIYRTVMRIVRNHDDALDVMQDSFVKAFTRIRSFRRASSFATWLTSIAVREAINRAQRDRFRRAVSLHLLGKRPSPAGANPDALAERSAIRERVAQAIEALPPVQRAVFTMRFYEELKVREIAELLGSSEGAVKASYFHAVRKLRRNLSGLR
ncbi:MAG: RNA polymerase sigma factor [Candidatus Eiseniibacteriota bacterium]|nr:MAG: RNA polymerase sigma factor [Candidatus Eisenbacteria bacterium]